mmetsp:Transcript_19653/g.35571  ORF Transcript_19653/g.35571 Transcript_19653/m.35571 type:complete len:106 (+) Transcript_19653:100-417(+)
MIYGFPDAEDDIRPASLKANKTLPETDITTTSTHSSAYTHYFQSRMVACLFMGLIRTSGDEMRNQDMNPATNTPAPPKMAMMGYVPGSLNQYFCLSAHLMEDVER